MERKRKPRVPKYRKHSSADIGFVEWEGKRHHLPGPYESPESLEAYRRFLAVHVEPVVQGFNVRRAPPARVSTKDPTVADLVLSFLDHAERYYPGTKSRGEYANCRAALNHLVKLYPLVPAKDFGPVKLKMVRENLIGNDVSRTQINAIVNRIKRCFKWGVSEELIPPEVHQSLTTVDGLRRGRTDARESDSRKDPVRWEQVAPILPFLSEQIAAMVQVQWFTGCRSQSVCGAKASQFDCSGPIWLWRPVHKTQFRGVDLVLPIGPKCQRVLGGWLDGGGDGFLFSPRDVRKNVRYKDHYTNVSYRQAILRAQDRAAVNPQWTPHQLRHGRGTEIRDRYGIEGAQAILGHESLDATQIYAERRMQLAVRIARETG